MYNPIHSGTTVMSPDDINSLIIGEDGMLPMAVRTSAQRYEHGDEVSMLMTGKRVDEPDATPPLQPAANQSSRPGMQKEEGEKDEEEPNFDANGGVYFASGYRVLAIRLRRQFIPTNHINSSLFAGRPDAGPSCDYGGGGRVSNRVYGVSWLTAQALSEDPTKKGSYCNRHFPNMSCVSPTRVPDIVQPHNAFMRWLWKDPSSWENVTNSSGPIHFQGKRVCEDSDNIWIYHASMNTTSGVHTLIDLLEADGRKLVDHTVAAIEIKVLYFYTALNAAFELKIGIDRERGHDRFRLRAETDVVPLRRRQDTAYSVIALEVFCAAALFFQTVMVFHHIFRQTMAHILTNERHTGSLMLTSHQMISLFKTFTPALSICVLRDLIFVTYISFVMSSFDIPPESSMAVSSSLTDGLEEWLTFR